MALQDYAKLPVFINGAYMTQVTSIEASLDSGQQPVNLLDTGLAGFTPGSGAVTITLGFALPIGGMEYNAWNDAQSGAYVDLQLGMGAEAYGGRGKIMNVRISQSTGASVEGSAEWMGEMNALK